MNRLALGALVIVFAVVAWRAAVRANSGDTDPRRPETLQVKHGGLTRTSLVYVPSGYDGKTAVPLVLSFHGRRGQGKDQASLSDFHKLGEQYGFIVAYPDGVGKSWNALHGTGDAEARGIDDVGFVDALLTSLNERFKIDPDRIYATGMSNGGFFTHRLGCERSTRFAAIATVAGEMAPALAKVCKPEEPIPVLIIHGTRDKIVPYEGGMTEGGGSLLSAEKTAEMWSRMNKCGSEMKQTFKRGQVVARSYERCQAPVTLMTVEGAGHTWPGGDQYMPRLLVGNTNRDVNASEMIWEFFAANPRRARPGAPRDVDLNALSR